MRLSPAGVSWRLPTSPHERSDSRSAVLRLVNSNWLRTGLWTARGALVTTMLAVWTETSEKLLDDGCRGCQA